METSFFGDNPILALLPAPDEPPERRPFNNAATK
jgi:hypothetical protein